MINGTEAGSDLSYFLVYANQVTHNLFGLFMVISFFIVIFIGSIFMQLRFRNTVKPETSLLASSFATLGFATVLQSTVGILNPLYFFGLIGIFIMALIWNILSD